MGKLELKHLAPYLPYGICCYLMGEPTHNIIEIVGANIDYVEIHEIGRTITDEYPYCDITPKLRPLCQLTQEIEHNGERFVPIIELFKFHNKNSIRVFPSSENYELDHYSHCVIYDDKNVFGYSNYGAFVAFTEGNNHLVVNQNELLAKLYEWHFDVFGLIEKGLAVRKD